MSLAIHRLLYEAGNGIPITACQSSTDFGITYSLAVEVSRDADEDLEESIIIDQGLGTPVIELGIGVHHGDLMVVSNDCGAGVCAELAPIRFLGLQISFVGFGKRLFDEFGDVFFFFFSYLFFIFSPRRFDLAMLMTL